MYLFVHVFIHIFTWIIEVETIKRQTMATCGCMATESSQWPWFGRRPRLYAGPVCDNSTALAAYAAFVVLYKWSLTFTFVSFDFSSISHAATVKCNDLIENYLQRLGIFKLYWFSPFTDPEKAILLSGHYYLLTYLLFLQVRWWRHNNWGKQAADAR